MGANIFSGAQFVIVGFPKCGTTALCERLALEPEVHIGKLTANNYESDISQLDCLPDGFIKEGTICGHKNVAYTDKEGAIEAIAASGATIIVCIRSPIKVLYSWHRMHKHHADIGIGMPMQSEANRNFYRNCSVQDYFNRFAKWKLDFSQRLKFLSNVASPDSLILIRQESMAQDMESVVSRLGERLGFKIQNNLNSKKHVAYADRAEISISERLQGRLHREQEAVEYFLGLYEL